MGLNVSCLVLYFCTVYCTFLYICVRALLLCTTSCHLFKIWFYCLTGAYLCSFVQTCLHAHLSAWSPLNIATVSSENSDCLGSCAGFLKMDASSCSHHHVRVHTRLCCMYAWMEQGTDVREKPKSKAVRKSSCNHSRTSQEFYVSSFLPSPGSIFKSLALYFTLL